MCHRLFTSEWGGQKPIRQGFFWAGDVTVFINTNWGEEEWARFSSPAWVDKYLACPDANLSYNC